jgi:HlyD family secretion protein
MKRNTWIAAGVAAVLAAGLLAWAFAPRPVQVETAQVTQGRFEATIDEDGKTRLRDRYIVSAPLAGAVDRITLREGDTVKAGDVVATLMPALSPLLDDRTLREHHARVGVAEANVLRVEARIEVARLGLKQAHNEAQRSEQLARQGFVSPTKAETDALSVQAAVKELDAATQERHVARHEAEQARAAIAAARGSGQGRAFVLRAPVSGRVLKVAQTSAATVGLGTPLLELGDTAHMDVVAELLTTDALQARPGSRVVIERWGGPGTLDGRVRLVEPAAFTKVSALGVEEQRVKVLIDITTPPEQWRALGDGYRVAVRIVTEDRDGATTVPVSAVFPRPDAAGMAVFMLDGGRARLVNVQLGARNGSQAWVKQGLTSGDEVIVYPPAQLRDGLKVSPRKV